MIGSVQRALSILELLAANPEGLNAKQVALKMQLNLSTCYHLLNTLEYEGYAVKDPDSLLFRISGKVGYTVLGQASSAQLVQILLPHVQHLQELTRETAYISVWDGDEIMLAAIVETSQSVQVKLLTMGEVWSNHASALGKMILAHFDDDSFDRYFSSRPMPAYTSNTITSKSELRKIMPAIKQRGYALDQEEFMEEVLCVGAPVFDAWQNITASVAISMPVSRGNCKRTQMIEAVKHIADNATRTLQIIGYCGPASRFLPN